MEDEKFFCTYQTIKFQEDNSDCFSVAATKRKLMVLNFFGSTFLKKSNKIAEFLLNEDLREYGKVVDDRTPGKVNNYADQVLSHLSNYQNDDTKNWKSNLNKLDVKEYLEDLSFFNDSRKNAALTTDEFKEIAHAFARYKETDEVSKTEKSKEFFKSLRPEKSHCPVKRHVNPTRQGGDEFSGNMDIDSKALEYRIILDKKDKPTTSKDTLVFHTARDELQIQNAKKFGKNGNGNERNFSFGTGKKSLGTRKRVNSKFQPPIKSKENIQEEKPSEMDVDEEVDERLKCIDPAMIKLIENEIMCCSSTITWDDIAGLHLAKTTIQEIVVWPMLRPDIFTGLRRPPKGILLFGPPGTGKTLIGKCIASQSNSTFFSISASSLTSKWVGDGEKMVRTLFAVAKVNQPSVIFIDEIDSLLSQRSDNEHECSRRIKTEFLVQLDGAGTGDEDSILIIGATNRPQELDEAARRRLVKRLYIPLPNKEARKQIIENLIMTERHCLEEFEIEKVASLTKRYSGADVKNLCQEASLGPIRSIPPPMIESIDPKDVRPLNFKDFESALTRIKSSVSESDLDIYVAWDKQYGCGSDSQS